LAAAPAILSAQARRPPNVVFILADDLGYGDLGCYGQSRIQTPNLDRFASEGIRFTQAYAGSTVCAPSRCCLMTGKHTGHATVRGNRKPEIGLRPEEATVASLLKNAGYETALFGKWGLGGPGTGSVPNTRGFDQFYGYLDQQHAHNAWPEHLWDNQNEVFLTGNWFYQRKQFAPDLFADRAIQFLSQKRDKPFFLYFPTILPHANNELGRVHPNGMESPDLGAYADKAWPDVEKTFAAAVTRVDSYVGRILDTLDKAGVAENTLVIFSSDNGPHAEGNHKSTFFESSGALHGIKRDLYDGGIRVPTLTRWKGTIKPGQVSDAQWAFWDVLPTVCALTGARTPSGLDGVNALPALTQGKAVSRDYLYWEFHEGGFAQALRQGDWKLVRQRPKFTYELFDLSKDPAERNDLSAQHPEVLVRLRKLLDSARTADPAFPVA
jgi:arylsulfatase A-like enzyme